MSQHLSTCPSCTDEQQRIRQLGDALRADAVTLPNRVNLQGMASGIISRTRAEDAQSWRALLARASEDWHWALVGVGSLVAAATSILLVAAICGLGPRPDREDSLAAMLNNLQTPAGTLCLLPRLPGPISRRCFCCSTAETRASGLNLRPCPRLFPARRQRSRLRAVTGSGRAGRTHERFAVDAGQLRRQHAEALLDEIQRLTPRPAGVLVGHRVSIQFGFVTNTSVSGKAL